MSLSKIRLELARDHDFPDGSRERGYEFTAPLSDDGRILVPEWDPARDRWCDASGAAPTTKSATSCASPAVPGPFHYDVFGDPDDDETGYRFGDHRFVPGEYVSIKEHDDVLRTFRVTVIRPLK
jgi:hypothetical protein